MCGNFFLWACFACLGFGRGRRSRPVSDGVYLSNSLISDGVQTTSLKLAASLSGRNSSSDSSIWVRHDSDEVLKEGEPIKAFTRMLLRFNPSLRRSQPHMAATASPSRTLIVESPTKAKTIGKYLGKDYTVLASYGHVRDLRSKAGSVLPDEDFRMIWDIPAKSKGHLKKIEDAVEKSDIVLLAPDPDREGEAIAWHLADILKDKLQSKKVSRVVFHEITKSAIEEAIKQPRDISGELVDAYLARRALDYLFGFTLSPVLWRKLPGARSAGRVQSVALRRIVEREEEVDTFKEQEYWDIACDFKVKGSVFRGKLKTFEKKRLQKFSITEEKQANATVAELLDRRYSVDSLEAKERSRSPSAPYTTSTMQQDASTKLGFSPSKTMKVAQELYEGIAVEGETVGLITYMRTDSVVMSKEAIGHIRDFIPDSYGKKYLPKICRVYKSKAKNAQEAHEAIRPTRVDLTIEKIGRDLSDDQKKLYAMIWNRAVASQMESARFQQVAINVISDDGNHAFRATGQTCLFDGFLKVYELDEETVLPSLEEGESLDVQEMMPQQHFTKPPARFSEATLIKDLEELGIGRPSTYAPMVETLKKREYVKIVNKRLVPEFTGRVVTLFLRKHFHKYIEYNFTAGLEDELDIISAGDMDWKQSLDSFWKDLNETVKGTAELRVRNVIDDLEHELRHILHGSDGRACPNCRDGNLSLKLSKFGGGFLGCSNYPECNFSKVLSSDSDTTVQHEPKFLGALADDTEVNLKFGRFGPYFQYQKGKDKPRNMALPSVLRLSPDEATLDHAEFLYSIPKVIGQMEGADIILAKGAFGGSPKNRWHLKHGEYDYGLPFKTNVFELDEDAAVAIIHKVSPKKRAPIDVEEKTAATRKKKTIKKKTASGKKKIASDTSRSAFETLTIPSLKEKLRSHGLMVSGRKAELVDRLEEHMRRSALTR